MKFEFLADQTDAIPIVAKWYFNEWGDSIPGNSIQKTIERISGKLNRDKAPLHTVAIENEKILGVGQLKQYEMDIYPDKEFWLGSLFVSPDSRRKGVGSNIANHIASVAEKLGVRELYLQTEALDGGLYRYLGWQIIETRKHRDMHVAVMVRHLKS